MEPNKKLENRKYVWWFHYDDFQNFVSGIILIMA
jgi:hypothetical protein